MTSSPGVLRGLLFFALISVSVFPLYAQQTVVINYGDAWKFNIPASDPGTSWRTVAFNDNVALNGVNWGSGPGLLGFETATLPQPGIQTAVGVMSSAPVTYLFRKTFNYTGDTTGMSFSIDQIVDDGVTYYLNGNLLGSVRHTPGAWNNYASASVGDAATEMNALSGAVNGLVNGTNVLCAEVHQIGAAGSDMVFGTRFTIYKSDSLTSSAWRTQHFGSSANSGNGADLADPDKDGLVNMLEYGLGKDPNKYGSGWGSPVLEGGYLTLTYARRKSALSEMTITAQVATDPNGTWSSAGVTEQVISDNGSYQTIKASVVSAGIARKFFKVNAILIPTSSSNGPAWKTFMLTYIGNTVWSDGQNYDLSRVNQPGRALPGPGVTVTNIQHIREVVDFWAALGGTHISFPIGWDETEVALGQFEFRKVDWAINYAASKGIKCNIYLWPLLGYGNPAGPQYDTTVSWKYEESDVPRRPDGQAVHNFMSFYSSRMPNFHRWLNAAGNHLASHWNAGRIGYVSVVTTSEKEFSYSINGELTDFHPSSVSAYSAWHNTNYGSPANPPDFMDGGTTGKRWLKFRTLTLDNFMIQSGTILKQYAPFRLVWDVGSFTDGDYHRGVWGALAGASKSVIDGYKHNPAAYYPAAFDTRAAVGVTGWASIEWTNAANDIADYAQRRDQFLSQMKISIDCGASDLSFAFFDGIGNPTITGMMNEIVSNLKSTGYWNKPVPPANNPLIPEITVSVSNVIQNGSYWPYHAPFNTAVSGGNGYPNVKVVNDLP